MVTRRTERKRRQLLNCHGVTRISTLNVLRAKHFNRPLSRGCEILLERASEKTVGHRKNIKLLFKIYYWQTVRIDNYYGYLILTRG